MKRNLYITILALAALTSCAKVEMMDVAPAAQTASNNTQAQQEKEIGFTVANYANQTKASTPMADDQNFKVYGIYTGSDSFAAANLADAVDYIPGKVIEKVNGVWKNRTETYYWPKTGKLSFAAFSPATSPLSYNRSANMFYKNGYTVSTEDLLVADFVADKTATNAAVPVLFRHALSQVSFTVKAGTLSSNGLDFQITVKKITILGTSQTADFKWAVSNTITWDNLASASEKVAVNANQALTTDAADYGTAILAIPQGLANAQIKVDYELVTKNGATTLDTAQLSDTISINGDINAWAAGTSYLYNLTINPMSSINIEFDPAVVDWNTSNSKIDLE